MASKYLLEVDALYSHQRSVVLEHMVSNHEELVQKGPYVKSLEDGLIMCHLIPLSDFDVAEAVPLLNGRYCKYVRMLNN